MRSNSLSTRGCGERMQTVSFVEVRFVVTVRQIIENWPKGQVLWCVCSRIVTDSYDAWPRGTSFNRMSTMRFAVWPSQRGGMRPALPFPASVSRAAATILPGSVPTSRFVPWEMVMGRSVFSRSVRQGTPRAVVSSWMPPESVRTSLALLRRQRKSRRSEEHTSELQSRLHLVCRLLLEKKKKISRQERDGTGVARVRARACEG